MRILVTGAHGFIGSHLCRHLLAEGHSVRALVTPWGRLDRLAGVLGQEALELVRANVTRPAELEGVCDGTDAIVHAAARLADWGPEDPIWETNVGGTRSLLAAASQAGTPRFVLVSSVAVHRFSGFVNADSELLPRDDRLTAYGRSKIAAEDLVFAWSGEGVVVRPGLWPFGPLDSQTRRVAAALLEGRLPLLAGGSRVLNTAYVGNLVRGLQRAVEAEGIARRAFLVADEGKPTWREVLGELAALLGAPEPRLSLPPQLVAPVAAGIETLWSVLAPGVEPPLTRYRASLMRHDVHFSIEAARRDLDYRPLVGWREGLALTVENDPQLRDWAKR